MGDNIPAALLDKHQKEGRVSTRVTVDTNFQEQVNKPKPMPRVRKPATPAEVKVRKPTSQGEH